MPGIPLPSNAGHRFRGVASYARPFVRRATAWIEAVGEEPHVTAGCKSGKPLVSIERHPWWVMPNGSRPAGVFEASDLRGSGRSLGLPRIIRQSTTDHLQSCWSVGVGEGDRPKACHRRLDRRCLLAGGKSELGRARWLVTPTRREPRESATEKTQPGKRQKVKKAKNGTIWYRTDSPGVHRFAFFDVLIF